ncbi:MAG: helix-turn-helix domain-containing protein [Cyanobacteria bacterium Co-bin13]|nr:helix-turn-helix domain-containing protein [Cyanobacteria bacterium Co-bin13]
MKKKANTPDSIYREQLQEIGSILKEARENRQLHLEDVADKTLIRGSLLRAIETGDLDNLPEPIYTRGLIRRYGEILDLDGETLASQFFAPAARVRRRTSWKETPAAQLRPLHLYAAYLVLMVAAVSGLSYVLRQTAPEASALPPLDPLAAQPQSETAAQDSAAAADPGESNQSAQAANHPIQVETTLTAQSWLRVVSDGKTEFEGILQPGENRLWTANQALTVRAGNAGGVVVSYNNGQAEALGKPGMVAEITYSPAQTIGLAF